MKRTRSCIKTITVLALQLSLVFILACQAKSQVKMDAGNAFPELSAKEHKAFQKLRKEMPRLKSVPLDFSKDDHVHAYTAMGRLAGLDRDSKAFKSTIDSIKKAHRKSGMTDPGLVYLVEGKKLNYLGKETTAPVGPVQAITGFENTDPSTNTFSVSALVSLPNPASNPIVTCTHTLQVYDEHGNPQGNADVVTQEQACENVQLHARGSLDASDQWAEAKLTTTWTNASGPQTPLVMSADGSKIPTQIISADPNDKNGDDMIKFCFGRVANDCDYMPSGASRTNVHLPIDGNTIYEAALVDPKTDPDASVSISITHPNPDAGGGCNLVANVSDFMNTVTLSNNNQTVNWNDTSVQFPAIDSTCMPNGSVVYFNMSMNIDMAGSPEVPTFFGISSSPDTPVSTGYYLQLVETRIYWSCLAEGTMVTMADGSKKAIESLVEGEEAVLSASGEAMQIHSLYTGEEETIYEVATDNGMVVRLTEGHPVITPDGPKLTRFLQVGDEVITENGTSAVKAVNLIPYGGKVYNLSLIPAEANGPQDMAAAGGSTFYGNGLLVGDNEMQWLYDRPDAEAKAEAQAPIKAVISKEAKAIIESRTGHALDPNQYIVR